jgi:hypothetical protein
MGYIKGLPKMIGWFGLAPDEESDEVRGLVLPKEYEFNGNDVVDLDSSALLSESAIKSVDHQIKLLAAKLAPG